MEAAKPPIKSSSPLRRLDNKYYMGDTFFWGNNYGMAAGDIDASGLWSTRPSAAPQARYSGLRYQKLTAGRTEVKGNLLAAASVLLSAQSHEIYLRDTIYSF